MKKRDRPLNEELAGLEVPPHRPGFWETVEFELERVGAADDADGGESVPIVVPLGRGHRRRRPTPWFAASAAAAVVLVLGVTTALLRPGEADDIAAPGDSVATTMLGDDIESLGGVRPATAEDGDEAAQEAPWSGPAVRQAVAPAPLAAQWLGSPNRRWCAAVAPAGLETTQRATVRAAEYPTGWAIAYDLPAGPGQQADGSDCADCGRSAFGVAGTGTTHAADPVAGDANSLHWSDGSRAGWGDGTVAESATKRVAEIVVAGQGCIYEVWSNLGEAHLVTVVESLRLVDGLSDGEVQLRAAGDPPRLISLREPPWAGAPIPAGRVDPLVFEQWVSRDAEAPRVMLASLGPGMEDAIIRTWGQGVAWDNPSGPGHTGLNQPCADCGRGVIGIGWHDADEIVVREISLPNRIEWEDGSYAEFGGRLSDPALPREKVRFLDPETGEPTLDALQATIHIAGTEGEVVVWTHLGEDHLLALLAQLRFVEG